MSSTVDSVRVILLVLQLAAMVAMWRNSIVHNAIIGYIELAYQLNLKDLLIEEHSTWRWEVIGKISRAKVFWQFWKPLHEHLPQKALFYKPQPTITFQ